MLTENHITRSDLSGNAGQPHKRAVDARVEASSVPIDRPEDDRQVLDIAGNHVLSAEHARVRLQQSCPAPITFLAKRTSYE